MSPQFFNAPRSVHYNPAFLSEDDLIRSFVVRQVDLELVLEVVDDNLDATNQHLLVVGPRGSGKTSLLRRAAISIKRDSERSQHWFPLIFTEESYEVTSVGELWLETLMHLADQTKDEGLRRSYEELHAEHDDDRLRERALALILDFADARGVCLILVIENLHMLADQLSDDDSWKIRYTLQNEARIMVLASATTRFEQIQQTNKAFYELFKVHELPRLNLEECGVVWSAVTRQELTSSIRPIHILTGGNLRLLTIISSFAHDRTFSTLLSDLMLLVDEHTAYFKSHLDGLPTRERKVYLALAELWAPSTAREVSGAARVDINQTSSLLNRLVKRGAVAVVGQVSRKKIYQLNERLYNVYYLMRRRGSPSQRVKAAVGFMLAYYGEGSKELAQFVAQLAKDACEPDARYRAEHISAHNSAAWYLYEHAPPSTVVIAERWAERAVEGEPNNPHSAHTHATVLASLGRITQALEATRIYLADPECVAATIKDGVTLFVELAAHDAAGPAAELLRASPSAQILEAVLIALEIETGQSTSAPRELFEIAKDIREDIRQRRAALAETATSENE